MPDLVILRGLPGSGKTTLAKESDRVHYEADKFFEYETGNYEFDRTKLAEAHKWCQDSVKIALMNKNKVIVSNTFVRLWEMQPYIDMCKELGKTYEIQVATGNFKNIHGVPDEAIERMRMNWEEFK